MGMIEVLLVTEPQCFLSPKIAIPHFQERISSTDAFTVHATGDPFFFFFKR
jgi:hypothetical protein